MKPTWLLVALLGACTGGTTSQDTSPRTGSAGGTGAAVSNPKPGNLKPTGGGRFVKGAPLSPAKSLIAWFEAQKRNGEPRLTRVPIVLKRGDVGFSPRGVRIGGAPDALEVYVSDAALGVGITDRARTCTAETCPFIVEGYWRGDEDGVYHYELRTASSAPITPQELAAFTHAEVEGESGNGRRARGGP